MLHKKYDLSNVYVYFISRDDPKTFILLYKIQKIQVNKYLTF